MWSGAGLSRHVIQYIVMPESPRIIKSETDIVDIDIDIGIGIGEYITCELCGQYVGAFHHVSSMLWLGNISLASVAVNMLELLIMYQACYD
jgi:hypothetical protein